MSSYLGFHPNRFDPILNFGIPSHGPDRCVRWYVTANNRILNSSQFGLALAISSTHMTR